MNRTTMYAAMDADLLQNMLDGIGHGKRVLKMESIIRKRVQPFRDRLDAIRADEKDALGIDLVQLCSQTKITLVY